MSTTLARSLTLEVGKHGLTGGGRGGVSECCHAMEKMTCTCTLMGSWRRRRGTTCWGRSFRKANGDEFSHPGRGGPLKVTLKDLGAAPVPLSALCLEVSVLAEGSEKNSPPTCLPRKGECVTAWSLDTSCQCHCPHRVWRRGSPRSHLRAMMCGMRWCGTSPLTSPLKAPTPLAVSLLGPCRNQGEVPQGSLSFILLSAISSWLPITCPSLVTCLHHLAISLHIFLLPP